MPSMDLEPASERESASSDDDAMDVDDEPEGAVAVAMMEADDDGVDEPDDDVDNDKDEDEEEPDDPADADHVQEGDNDQGDEDDEGDEVEVEDSASDDEVENIRSMVGRRRGRSQDVPSLRPTRSSRAAARGRKNYREDDVVADDDDDGNGGDDGRGDDSEGDDDDDDDEEVVVMRDEEPAEEGRRRSARSTKFSRSMKDPADSVNDLFNGTTSKGGSDSSTAAAAAATRRAKGPQQQQQQERQRQKTAKKAPPKKPAPAAAAAAAAAGDASASVEGANGSSKAPPASPPKSRGRHSTNRKSALERPLPPAAGEDADDDHDDDWDESDDGGRSDDDEEVEAEVDETLKIQRILASRSETRRRWKEICSKMNSSEVTNGSRWYQPPSPEDDDDGGGDDGNVNGNGSNDIIEERFLVKWNGLSYLHVSWETQQDLLDQVENARNYMSTFFRKAEGGTLFSSDERKDGDYFDPGFVEVDRILQIAPPENFKGKLPTSWEEEQAADPVRDFGVVRDNNNAADNTGKFEGGTGRQFLVKFVSLNYSECSFEFERDLLVLDVDFQDQLREYYERTKRPTKADLTAQKKAAEAELRRGYKLFGERSDIAPADKAAEVVKYQKELCDHVFRNGGQLRDYQAEGVSWFMSNYINGRSCIMADEMGLGKTLQTAAFINTLVKRMHVSGPFLVCVPLSTITHWQREFVGWTGLNTIVYHGSALDRERIRQHEFAYEQDRPASVGSNAVYLRRCEPYQKKGPPWMATVVITTPEMMVADDWAELAAVRWEVLVVDEAHRLKNHNSKLAQNLRRKEFQFAYRLLLTGTPIQNDVKEFWTLMNFIDPDSYDDIDVFLEKYGDIKSKEKIDDLHEAIRPYILRRLKEDVEKSVPPKEETLIEVELTIAQKQYYRALYEKNVQFLHKNKKKALDGPSLNNLAMQLRKCCNHLFLLNGVEEEIRSREQGDIDEGDFVTRSSGKLVLLDKLLPRLKEKGHRVLVFSQFKIMLDILEDYLNARRFGFERIDGSITGHKRQAAIDRFQDAQSKDPPFVMLLSTRAGGVGINLTAADTCIIFDSDWNPQNDVQAMARCHRIGQTKDVKVYRLLTRKTYEMQMFHLSSLKMGLDQAVLTGFESGSSGEGAMSKEEVERLLRHGAYDIFNEDKAGTAEAESNDFIQQDIDSILERRSRKVVHENTGSGSAAAGGTFSKASFVNTKASSVGGINHETKEDVDINDPDFWTKMVGDAKPEAEESILKPRQRKQTNYNENLLEKSILRSSSFGDDDSGSSSSDGDSDDSAEDPDSANQERARWGGHKPSNWKRTQADNVLALVEARGYGLLPWEEFVERLPKDCRTIGQTEIHRMAWSMVLLALCEISAMDATAIAAKAERKRDSDGDGLGNLKNDSVMPIKPTNELKEEAFTRLWKNNSCWAKLALDDAVIFARANVPRSPDTVTTQEELIRAEFYTHLWPALEGRGWKEDDDDEGVFFYQSEKFASISAVMNDVLRVHPELTNMVLPLLVRIEESRTRSAQMENQARAKELAISASNVNLHRLQNFIDRYAPMQLLHDRIRKANKIALGRRLLTACFYSDAAQNVLKAATDQSTSGETSDEKLLHILAVDGRSTLPHPLWTNNHDALLLRGIADHGWGDDGLKGIIGDRGIKWGFPFEVTKNAPIQRMGLGERENLRSTAERAASVLNKNFEVFEAMIGFNKTIIIDTYGLTRHEIEGDKIDDASMTWRVDQTLLHQASKKSDHSQEAVELPAKKDLAKRAKAIISKAMARLNSSTAFGETGKKATEIDREEGESHDYAVINQGNPCYVLLAELIRAVLKGSNKSAIQMRMMWNLIRDEAVALTAMLSTHSDKKTELDELKKIMSQIKLAKKSSSCSMTQAKNILRVMIGEKPIPPRNQAESMFPAMPAEEIDIEEKAKSAAKRETKKNEPALGERALGRALKKAQDKQGTGPVAFTAKEEDSLGLQLTMVEVYILSAFCMESMPLVLSSTKVSGLSRKPTWVGILQTLHSMAKEQLRTSVDALNTCKAALDKARNEGFGLEAVATLASKVAKAEADHSSRDEAASTVADYLLNHPTSSMAKKSIMLVEKIREFGFSNASANKSSNKYENYLGPKILPWFAKQVNQVAAIHDILDRDRKTLSLTTADLLTSNPNCSESAVAAFLDKKSARQVISQIALLTRLRSILLECNEDGLRSMLSRAIRSSSKAEDEWEKKPGWWDDSSTDHSFLLLTKLDKHGFLKIMSEETARDGFGDANEDYADMKGLLLTKPVIQQRANQLVRELHYILDHETAMQLLKDRKNKADSKRIQQYDSLVDCHSLGSVSASSGKAKTTVQTGLKAFFSAANNPKLLVVNADDAENGSHDSLASIGKRKESPLATDYPSDDSPAGKRVKQIVINGVTK